MFRAAVIYAPGALQAAAERIAACLDHKRFKVRVHPAGQASIADLAAADLVLLGSAVEGRAALPAEFAEIARALSGINLAGRVAGVFTAAGEAPLAAWRKALKDTGIRLEENLLRSDAADARSLSAWVAGLARQVEELAGGR